MPNRTTPRKIKVLSYNIHKGFNALNRDYVLDEIRESIRLVGADLVFLQEVIGQNARHAMRIKGWPKTGQFEFLADSVWQHHAYGKNAVYSSGHHGNAILSKFPILGWENKDLTVSRLEKRGALTAMIQIPERGLELRAMNVHLDLFESGRKRQLEKICRAAQEAEHHRHPMILAGDFNDWGGKATHFLESRLGLHEAFAVVTGSHARTFPSWYPILQLDRVYYRGLGVKNAFALTGPPWNVLSDHAAVCVEFEV